MFIAGEKRKFTALKFLRQCPFVVYVKNYVGGKVRLCELEVKRVEWVEGRL